LGVIASCSVALPPRIGSISGRIDDLKTFLEGLQAFNTPGKLKNFSRSVLEIQGHVPTLDLIKQIEDLNTLVQELTTLTSYLGTAARTAYFILHKKARLGANEDGKKKELLKDVLIQSIPQGDRPTATAPP
jgi:hypothetical protein